MNPLMAGKGYATLIGVIVTFVGRLVSALGEPEIGSVIEEAGVWTSGAGVIRKGVAGL